MVRERSDGAEDRNELVAQWIDSPERKPNFPDAPGKITLTGKTRVNSLVPVMDQFEGEGGRAWAMSNRCSLAHRCTSPPARTYKSISSSPTENPCGSPSSPLAPSADTLSIQSWWTCGLVYSSSLLAPRHVHQRRERLPQLIFEHPFILRATQAQKWQPQSSHEPNRA